MFRTYLLAVYLQDPQVADPKHDRIKTVIKSGAVLKTWPKNHDPATALAKHLKKMVDGAEYERLRAKQDVVMAGYFCSRCGHGIGLGECAGCGRYFRDDRVQTGTGGQLPPTVRQWFEKQGHKFEN